MPARADTDPASDRQASQHSQSTQDKLCFLRWKEWDGGRTYSELPASSIRYTVEWKIVEWKITTGERSESNKKIMAWNTEQNVVLSPTTFCDHILLTKLKNELKKIPPNRQFNTEDTNLVVSVNDRSGRDLVKQFDGTKIEWMGIENQLLACHNCITQNVTFWSRMWISPAMFMTFESRVLKVVDF